MSELYVSAVKVAYEKKNMGGGFDIMKRVYKKQRTGPKQKGKKEYYTNGYGIIKKWQEEKQNKPPKETNPQTGDEFDAIQKNVKRPTPVRKQSLMAPLEEYPKRKRPRKQDY